MSSSSYLKFAELLKAKRDVAQQLASLTLDRTYCVYQEGTEELRSLENSKQYPRSFGSSFLCIRTDENFPTGVDVRLRREGYQGSDKEMLELHVPLLHALTEKVWKPWIAGTLKELPPSTKEVTETTNMLRSLDEQP